MSKTNILLTSLMTHNFSRRKFHTPRQSNYSFFTIYGLDNISTKHKTTSGLTSSSSGSSASRLAAGNWSSLGRLLLLLLDVVPPDSETVTSDSHFILTPSSDSNLSTAPNNLFMAALYAVEESHYVLPLYFTHNQGHLSSVQGSAYNIARSMTE